MTETNDSGRKPRKSPEKKPIAILRPINSRGDVFEFFSDGAPDGEIDKFESTERTRESCIGLAEQDNGGRFLIVTIQDDLEFEAQATPKVVLKRGGAQ